MGGRLWGVRWPSLADGGPGSTGLIPNEEGLRSGRGGRGGQNLVRVCFLMGQRSFIAKMVLRRQLGWSPRQGNKPRKLSGMRGGREPLGDSRW